MTSLMRRPWLALSPVGLVAGAGALALVLTSDHEENAVALSVYGLLLGWTFIGTGLFGWSRRPDNATGRLMVAVGFAWFLGAFTDANSSIPYTIGMALGALALAAFIHLLFAFPHGRVEGKWPRLIVAAAYPVALLANLTSLLVDATPTDDCDNCPSNAFLVVDSDAAADALQIFWNLVGLAFIVAAAVVLAGRWRSSTAPARRVVTPVYVGGLASLTLVGLSFALHQLTHVSDVVGTVGIIAFVSVPFLFLAGLLRTRLARAGAAQLLQETAETPSIEEAQAGLRRALNDPTLRLLVRDDERDGYVDASGRAADVPDESERAAVTRLAYEGRPLAAIVHDPALSEEAEVLDDVLAAARLALVKDRSVHALRASERRNRALLDAIPDNMFRIRGDGTYVDFHSNRPDALTLPPEQIVGSTLDQHMPAEDAEVRMEAIRRVIATGRAETFELQVVDREGRVGDREVRMVKSGEDEVLAITRDITDRKRAEQEVVHQRDFLRTVVNTATSVFLVVTPTGEIVRFNDFCAGLTEREDDEHARGRLFWELFAAPEDATAMREAFAADAGREYEHHWASASGDRRLVAWSSTPIVDETGEVRRLIHGVDVSERRQQEEELRRSRARIVEAEATERRRLERNLHDGAQQRLVSLSLALRLAQGRLSSDPAGASEILGNASTELTHALEELRELARGIHPAVLTDRGLAPALETLSARATLPVEIEALPEQRLPDQVEAAAFYVVSEALTNVAKYAQASFASIRVTCGDGYAVVEVADDGVGGADAARGTGLRGLADRVDALDGDLVVESSPGEGTRVRAVIPLAQRLVPGA
jgi:PAS domain S-box-containing protein